MMTIEKLIQILDAAGCCPGLDPEYPDIRSIEERHLPILVDLLNAEAASDSDVIKEFSA